MKSFLITSILVFSLVITHAQDSNVSKATFKVKGVCEMCKMRIERAALIKGVKQANWDKQTGDMVVYYKKDKVTELDIQKAISSAGHETSEVEADSTAYQKLPYCCSYNERAGH